MVCNLLVYVVQLVNVAGPLVVGEFSSLSELHGAEIALVRFEPRVGMLVLL